MHIQIHTFFFLNSFLSLTSNISCAKKFWLQNINTSNFRDHCSFHSGFTHNHFSFRLLLEFPNCSPCSHSAVPTPHKQQKVKSVQSCPAHDPMDCGLPRSSLHGILQTRIPEWIMVVFSRGSSQPRCPSLQEDSLSSEPPGKQSEFLLYSSDHPNSLSRTLQEPPTAFIINYTPHGLHSPNILAPTYLSNLVSHYFLCRVPSIQVRQGFWLLLIHTNHSLPQGLCTYMPSTLSSFGKKQFCWDIVHTAHNSPI